MLIFNKLKISEDFKKLLILHFKSNYEVGGIIFAKRKRFYTMLDTLSFKKGTALSISFDDEDFALFTKPEGDFILGTWHTHPFQNEIEPSVIDIKQWNKWNKRLIHLIYNGNEVKIYTAKGELVYVGKI